MRKMILAVCTLAIASNLLGQVLNAPIAVGGARTYAVVVGISKYRSSGIPALQFAHRDASFFAQFLQSSAGGNVPAANITLLVNEKATFNAIYDAMYSVQKRVNRGDRVFFYFSGHGDVENKTAVSLGYLLAYNTPPNNYINHAVRIEDLNDFANTLSTRYRVQTILITDACRSGKLAGDAVSGRRWIGQQLRDVQSREVRLASCLATELSAEHVGWGGGRGVFSFYLLQGLYGDAAKGSSRVINADAVTRFVQEAFAKDRILREQRHKQTPVTVGNTAIELAKIDSVRPRPTPKTTGRVSNVGGFSSQWATLKSVPLQPIDYITEVLKRRSLDSVFNFDALLALPIRGVLWMVADSLRPVLSAAGVDSLNQYVLRLSKVASELTRFNERFSSIISSQGHQMISDYLDGDEAELDKRSYYNARRKSFDVYVKMYDLAIKLLPNDHFSRRGLLVDREYFAGVVERLKLNLVANGEQFLDAALMHQRRAMALEPFAPYVHNEMAQVLFAKGQLDSAIYHFKTASDLSPTWALPWANLVGLYNVQRNFGKAREAAAKARALQPNLSVLTVNEGVTDEFEKNYLSAEGRYLQSLRVNTLHYLPFERLGVTYATTARYQKADSFFYAAHTRKQGYFFPTPIFSAGVIVDELVPSRRLGLVMRETYDSCLLDIDTAEISKDNNLLILTPLKFWKTGTYNPGEADALFKAAIARQPQDFLLNYHYGRYLMEMGAGLTAEPFFLTAKANYKTREQYTRQLKQHEVLHANTATTACYERLLTSLHYAPESHYFFLAQLYANKGYYAEAEAALLAIITSDSSIAMLRAFQMLADMQMKGKNYQAAEQTWLQYINRVNVFLTSAQNKSSDLWLYLNHSRGAYELEQFYQTVNTQNPDDAHWQKRAGLYWKQKLLSNPAWYWNSTENGLNGLPRDDDDAQGRLPMLRFLRPTGVPANINFQGPVLHPFETGFAYLRKAAALASDDERIVDFNLALSELYQLKKQPDSAALCLAKALDIDPKNASVRIRLYHAQRDNFDFLGAYHQLDTLSANNGLLTNDVFNHIEMTIGTGNYKYALTLIQNQEGRFSKPDEVQQLAQLKSTLYAFSAPPKVAIGYITDSVPNAVQNPLYCYTLACLHAKNNELQSAMQWLSRAMEQGFRLGYLLQNDRALKNLWELPEWKVLIDKYRARFIKYQF